MGQAWASQCFVFYCCYSIFQWWLDENDWEDINLMHPLKVYRTWQRNNYRLECWELSLDCRNTSLENWVWSVECGNWRVESWVSLEWSAESWVWSVECGATLCLLVQFSPQDILNANLTWPETPIVALEGRRAVMLFWISSTLWTEWLTQLNWLWSCFWY